ncbi:MAG: hypothetical protein WEF86_01985 [Gemmatimonadota bacterium]
MRVCAVMIAMLIGGLFTANRGQQDARAAIPANAALAIPANDVGVIEGAVTLDVAAEGAPPMLSPYARRRYRSPTNPGQTASPIGDVVVYIVLDPPAASAAAASAAAAERPAAIIAQRDRTMMPRVTAITAGSRVEFPNQDEVFHNIFSLSEARPFNLGRFAPGSSRSQSFPDPGVVRMFCDIHSDMAAVILVLDNPYHARPDADGRFRIAGVPEGRHRLVAWHETAGADTTVIAVTAAAVARADFRLPR